MPTIGLFATQDLELCQECRVVSLDIKVASIIFGGMACYSILVCAVKLLLYFSHIYLTDIYM